jgi:hypothetical protein
MDSADAPEAADDVIELADARDIHRERYLGLAVSQLARIDRVDEYVHIRERRRDIGEQAVPVG